MRAVAGAAKRSGTEVARPAPEAHEGETFVRWT
jgi:hypothetical protein